MIRQRVCGTGDGKVSRLSPKVHEAGRERMDGGPGDRVP